MNSPTPTLFLRRVLAAIPICFAIALFGLTAWPALAAPTHPARARQIMPTLKWRSIGPYIGGRVVAVSGVASEPNLFYMGAVDGGVWKSTDYGIKWTPLSDGTLPGNSDSIGAIAVAPSNPNVIYVGTGESDIRGDMISGDGVFRSNDAGKTWHVAGLTNTHTIMGLVVDPKNPDIVYAASMGHVFVSGPHRGVFKSTNGGKTWHKILFIDNRTGAVDLVMDPAHPQVLYATTWQAYRTPWKFSSGGPGSGLWKTVDGGEHWTNLTHNPGLPNGVLGKMGVSVSANHPNIVYTIMQAKGGGVFRSNDGGAHWQRVNKEWKLRQRAFYYMAIFVDPKNPDTLYVPNVDAMWVSHNGGKTFTALHTPHGDNHIIWINPNNTKILLEGNDGGATVSTDSGKTWSTEHNQPTGQFYHVNLDHRFPFHIYGAQQDEGAFEAPSASSAGLIPLNAWHHVAYGESTVVVPQPDKPSITYGAGYYSIFVKYDRLTEQYQSVSPWPNYREGAASNQLKNRFGWIHPILFSPSAPQQLLIGSQYVLESNNHGHTWHRISPDLTRDAAATQQHTGGPVDLDQSGAEIYPSLSSIAVSPLNSKLIWAGSSDGLVHLTTDGGKHWVTARPTTLPKWSRITAIEPSYFAAGTAYLTARRYMWDDFQPYVFKTTDFGRHWSKITRGVPGNQYAMDIRQDPENAKLLFLATSNAVFVSLNSGAHWRVLGSNLPRVQVRGLAINTRQGMVVAATHGRAFWVMDNLALLEQLTRQPSITNHTVQVFAPETAWLSHAYGINAHAKRVPAAGANPPFGATVFFYIPAGYHGKTTVRLQFTDAQGHVIRSFALHLQAKSLKQSVVYGFKPTQQQAIALHKLTAIQPGLNRFQWNLRYTDATEVTGFEPPIAAGGLTDEVNGPVIVPGVYHVALIYGNQRSKASFKVHLDPRLHATQADLQARLALEMKIHSTLDQLDRNINQAIVTRERLQKAIAQRHLNHTQARQTLAALNHQINALVQLNIQSSEGSLLHETRLRSHLAYLAADIGLAYVRPSPAQYAVYKTLLRRAVRGERALQAASTIGQRLL